MSDSKDGLQIRFLNTDIEYSANQCLYYKSQHRFESYAQKAAEEYAPIYKTYQNYKAFTEKGIEDGEKLAKRYIDQGMQLLLASGIYSISRSEFENQCAWEIHQSWHEIICLEYELSEASGTAIKEAEDLREARKASRSRPVSVGFGLGGTVGSYAASSGINAISGLLHSGANAIGNARTRSAVREKLNELYQSPELLEAAQKCVYDSVLAIWGVVQVHLNLEDGKWEGFLISDEDQARARAYRENFVHIPKEKKDEIAGEILKFGIADIKNYEVLVRTYQDPSGVLMQAAQAFGLEEEYYSIVEKEISKKLQPDIARYIDSLDNVDLANIQETTDEIYAKVRYSLAQMCKSYHIDTSDLVYSRCWERIESVVRSKADQIYAKDRQARTFKGILFPSLESVDLAKSIWSRVAQINQIFDSKSSSEQRKLLHEIEQLLSQSPTQLKDSIVEIQEKLKKIYEETDNRERTFLNTLFPSQEARIAAEAQYRSLMAQWFPPESTPTPESMRTARQSVEDQKDLSWPVRQAILKQIAAQEQQFAEELHQQQVDKAYRNAESKLIVWNLLYGVIAIWAVLCWDIFTIDGTEISAIGLLQLFYHNTDTITAGRGFLAVGAIVVIIKTLANMRLALKRDLDDVPSHPGVILILGLLAWGLTALFHLSYGVTTSYITLLVISFVFQVINSSLEKKLNKV